MPRPLIRLLVAALLLALLPNTALAQPTSDPTDGSDRGPEAVDTGTLRDPDAPPAERFATPLPDADRDFAAVDCPLSEYPVDPADVSLAIGVTPYHDIAPRLCALSDNERITLEVAGTSTQGREMPLVTITAPETPEEEARNEELEELLTADPEAAAVLLEEGGYADYKPALMLNGNIHGNEWEGTDYALDLVEYLATAAADAPAVENTAGLTAEEIAELPTVGELLSEFRVVVLVTANPDGRVMGQRQNGRLIDMNRDHITQDQPEVVAMRDAIIEAQPLVFQDHHGYVNGSGQSSFYTGYGLIEPTTPPHGEAYEYDLYITSALPLAEQSEADILRRRAAGDIDLMERDIGVTIPFRDMEEGWDDWPPIFTPMYAMYHGVIGVTIEFPWSPRGVSDDEQRARNVRNNIEFGRATVDTMLVYGHDNRDELLANQLEMYRRGEAGAPSAYLEEITPDGIVPGFGDEDRWPTEFPRAYVITPGGHGGEVAAARLAQHLLDNDVEVSRLTEATDLAGTTYPAGSYVVDMHQAKRGLAHTMLDEGTDVSDRVDAMYDISGWSLALLWGAEVDEVDDAGFVDAVEPVEDAAPAGGVEAGSALGYALSLTNEDEIAALGRLWQAGVDLQRTSDGTVLVPASARGLLTELAADLDVPFRRVTELPADRTELPRLRVGAAIGNTSVIGQSTLHLLGEVFGFDITRLSRNEIRTTDLSRFDVLLFSQGQVRWSREASGGSTEDPTNLGPTGQQALLDYAAEGGAIVTWGRDAAIDFVAPSGLVEGLTAEGSRTDANGVLDVRYNTDSEVLPGRPAEAASFGYPIAWFPETGEATVEQTLAEDPLISGHWRPRLDDEGEVVPDQYGQDAAGGQPLTVSAELEGGGRLVAFGSEPFFRWHPKGLFDDVVDAMLWAADLPATDADLGQPYVDTGDLPERISGATRIETAVELSRTAYAPGVDTVVVATAFEFADALTAGPYAGAVDGPVLLTPTGSLPAVVAAEIERLEPSRIVIAGGEAAVGAAVEATLEDLAPEVVRFSGTTRYGTAAAFSSEYAEPGDRVVLATGMQFADALGGGVLAGRTGSSLLLVGREVLPEATAAELERLEPAEVVVLGGEAAVSDAVLDAVDELTGVTPRRVFGSDRFGTAAAIATEELDGAEVVFAATGASYADALAGVPVAIRSEGAVLLAMRDLVPPVTEDALEELQPAQVVVLGGAGVISEATASALRGD